MTIEGLSATEIAAMLNRENIPIPMQYKRVTGCSRKRWKCIREENFWTQGAINRILRDERYTGKCVYGKRECKEVGICSTAKRSRTDWIVVDDVHEGIVSKEEFQKAANRMREYKEYTPSISPTPSRNLLCKKVYCGT